MRWYAALPPPHRKLSSKSPQLESTLTQRGHVTLQHVICASASDPAFLLPLDKEPAVSVAGAALGEGFALISDNVWCNRRRPGQGLHL